jgi:N utilization substance protein A
MQTQFAQAIEQICEEKNIPKDTVMEAVEAALAAAYKKDYGEKDQEVRVHINEESGAIEVFVTKTVVEEVEDDFMEIALEKAVRLKKDVKVGDTVEIMDLPADFGRIAAQTAKQVIVQRIREAERDIVFAEYQDKEGEIVNCIVQRVEGDTVICDLGKSSAILYKNEQIPGERYYPNQRFRVFIVKVEQTSRGPQIVVSRSHPGMVKKLFETEVPEIGTGAVEIKGIAREAGGRTKIAVIGKEAGLDPVGSFVGQRGIRVQSVTNEIGGEKIDIILWNEDPKSYIENAISPAKVAEITLNDKEQKATVKVPEDQLSLAIGKQGQNVRLAAKLTGWNIDIEGSDSAGVEKVETEAQPKPKKEDKKDLEAAILEAVKAQNEEPVISADSESVVAESEIAPAPKVKAEAEKAVEIAEAAPLEAETDQAKTE